MKDSNTTLPEWLILIGKLILTVLVLVVSVYAGIILMMMTGVIGLHYILSWLSMLLLPALLIPLIFVKKRRAVLKGWSVFALLYVIAMMVNLGFIEYEARITIDTSPNINLQEYLPFQEGSKIATLEDEASLKLEDNLPIVDGAAALFPVYSAFVNATYPDTVTLYDQVFEYNNTVGGYKLLADRETDIFFGAYPSQEQIDAARQNGTEFVYTPIGSEAFVFFVHKDNPIDSLTTEQIQGIYSGEITNWKEVGGRDEKIVAFQRNEGSGSQSMLIRFMDGKELMEAPSELVNDFMSGIIEQVSDYKSKSNSIGFSFRYYVEGIIQNPDIKLIQIDGIAPTVENIKSGAYPVTTPIYAVTYEGNENENVDKLLQWVLSDEGQELIEKTGYVGIGE